MFRHVRWVPSAGCQSRQDGKENGLDSPEYGWILCYFAFGTDKPVSLTSSGVDSMIMKGLAGCD